MSADKNPKTRTKHIVIPKRQEELYSLRIPGEFALLKIARLMPKCKEGESLQFL